MQESEDWCSVYWIRKAEHTDIFSEGYVGVTITKLQRRWTQHKNAAKANKYPIHRAINKYGDELVCELILIGTKEYCLDIEKNLRPTPGIGYNSAAGGLRIGRFGSTNSEDTRAKLSSAVKAAYEKDPTYRVRNSQSKKGRVMPESQKENIKKSMKQIQYFPWTNSLARNDIWSRADVFYEFYRVNNTTSLKEMCTYFQLKYHNLQTMFNRFKSGWAPLEDLDWKEYFNK